jgi:hypothetical protein
MSHSTSRRTTQSLAAICTLIGLVCSLLPPPVSARTLNEMVDRWRISDYEGVLPQLIEYRKTPYGRNIQVDYMIATSLCRLNDLNSLALGRKFLRRMMATYELSMESRQELEGEYGRCVETVQQHQPPLTIDFSTGHADVGVRGKTFYWLDQQKGPLGGDQIHARRQIPEQALMERRFSPGERSQAVDKVSRLAGSGFEVVAVGRFIIASASGQKGSELEAIGRHLEATMRFFIDEYAMPPPEYLVTVYLTPSPHDLRRLADRVHGLELTSASIGYSFHHDFSIAGVASGVHSGILKHELFHLMVRNHFGDIPPWLDEGMAALYEVSHPVGERMLGLQNWRGDLLQSFWEMRPDLRELLQMDWRRFDAQGAPRERQAVIHATARYFALFLQERGELTSLYRALQQQQVFNLSEHPGVDSIGLLERTLRQSLPALERQFDDWFQSLDRPRRVVSAFLQSEGLTQSGRVDSTTLELLKAR